MILSPAVVQAAQAHAVAEYPRESCGLVVAGRYIACRNVAADPTRTFEIDPAAQLAALAAGPLEAVIHSHPDGPFFPSEADMRGQLASAVPWAIIATDGERAGKPEIWGDTLPIPALVGREFMHGIRDCYAIIRDAYRLGRDALAQQGIVDWPFEPVTLPEFPRDDEWWKSGQNLYVDNFKAAGFRPITAAEVRPGDVFLMKIRSEVCVHGGLVLADGLILHHLPSRLSRREPIGTWFRHFDYWLRFEGLHA